MRCTVAILRSIGIGLLTLLFTMALWASTTASDYAEKAFFDNQFDQAIHAYSKVLKQHPKEPKVLYNLGTSYLKAKQYGPAIFYLKQASLYSPRGSMIQENLRIARQNRPGGNTVSFGELMAPFRYLERIFSLREYASAVLILGSTLGVWMSLMLWLPFLNRFKILRRGLWGLLVTGLLCGVYFWQAYFYTGFIVIQPSVVPVHLYPNEALSPVMYLQSGTETRLLREEKKWSLIAVDDIGALWIPKDSYWKLNSGFHF